jgi:hypothetical protein
MPQGRPVPGGDRLPHVDVESRVLPGADQLHTLRREQFTLPQEPEYLDLEELPQHRTVPAEDGSPIPLSIPSASGDHSVQMWVEADPLTEGLPGNDHARHISFAHKSAQVGEDRCAGRSGEPVEQTPIVTKVDPQHLGQREHHMMVDHGEQAFLEQPLRPFLRTPGLAGRAESPAFTRERQKSLVPAPVAADPGEPVHGIPAVQKAGNDPFGDRPQGPVPVLELFLILRNEEVPVVHQQTIEGAAGEPSR